MDLLQWSPYGPTPYGLPMDPICAVWTPYICVDPLYLCGPPISVWTSYTCGVPISVPPMALPMTAYARAGLGGGLCACVQTMCVCADYVCVQTMCVCADYVCVQTMCVCAGLEGGGGQNQAVQQGARRGS